MTTYLGIDLGTSSSKVIIMDENQKILASASAADGGVAPASRLVRAGAGRLDWRDDGRD